MGAAPVAGPTLAASESEQVACSDQEAPSAASAVSYRSTGPSDSKLEALRALLLPHAWVKGEGEGDELAQLARIRRWLHQRWEHDSDNEPSRFEPMVILQEAEAGERFRCVEPMYLIRAEALPGDAERGRGLRTA